MDRKKHLIGLLFSGSTSRAAVHDSNIVLMLGRISFSGSIFQIASLATLSKVSVVVPASLDPVDTEC